MYKDASRQRLDKEKASIFFSRNTKGPVIRQILLDSEVEAINCFEKYLGVPTMVGRSRRVAFIFVKDQI